MGGMSVLGPQGGPGGPMGAWGLSGQAYPGIRAETPIRVGVDYPRRDAIDWSV